MSKIYLPGLNGIRAIAASGVVFGHVFERLFLFNQKKINILDYFAGYSVSIFFTLSGFLITYLLLYEKQFSKTINIKKFYLRRIFRIWPLYYFYLITTFIIAGYVYYSNLWYYIFIIPNVEFAYNAAFGLIAIYPLFEHYWSLGVEEQFYLIWPWIIKKAKNIQRAIFIFIVLFMVVKIALTIFNGPIILRTFFQFTRFSCLAIGAFGALLVYNKNKIISILNNKYIEILLWILLVLFLFNILSVYSIVNNEVVSCFILGIIIIQINPNKRPIINLENNIMDFLGKISFGLYVYNPIVIYLISKFFSIYNFRINVVLLSIIVYVLTIMVSYMSYSYFEKPFLKIKEKFMVIKSASNSKDANE